MSFSVTPRNDHVRQNSGLIMRVYKYKDWTQSSTQLFPVLTSLKVLIVCFTKKTHLLSARRSLKAFQLDFGSIHLAHCQKTFCEVYFHAVILKSQNGRFCFEQPSLSTRISLHYMDYRRQLQRQPRFKTNEFI